MDGAMGVSLKKKTKNPQTPMAISYNDFKKLDGHGYREVRLWQEPF
jgi:hypothetical protein